MSTAAVSPAISPASVLGFLRPVRPNQPTQRESEIVKEFLRLFPEASEDVFSYIQDSSCSCKQSLIHVLNANPDRAQQFVDFLYGSLPPHVPKPRFSVTFDGVAPMHERTAAYGEVVEIPQDPAAYRQLLHRMHAEQRAYQGLCVVPTETTWKIFFY